jgi:hypothetical protein
MTLIRLYRIIAILSLVISSLVGCKGYFGSGGEPLRTATQIPTMEAQATLPATITDTAISTSKPGLESFMLPTSIDPDGQYMFYLHGKIIEDQGLPAVSSEFGQYRYEEILSVLRNHGFIVISEQRLKDADTTEYARRITRQVNDLLMSDIPPGSITVVGASKGAIIASLVSAFMMNPEVNYVLLGGCYQPVVDEWIEQDISLSGNVLSIYDSSDEYASSCEQLVDFSDSAQLGQYAELVLHVGTGHGILYEPLEEWVSPTVNWAKGER